MMQALRSAFELKEKGILTETEYAELKERLLVRLKTTVPAEPVVQQDRPNHSNRPWLDMYASDLHRMIVQEMYRQHADTQGDSRNYMVNMLSTLLQHRALQPSDVSHMQAIVDTVCDDTFGQNGSTLMRGAAKLQSVDSVVRLSGETSGLARAIAGIAHSSAQNALLGMAPPDSIVPPTTEVQSTSAKPDPRRRWGIVKDDVNGALSGAGLVVGIVATPAAAAAATAIAGALGPAIGVLGTLGALIAAGVVSGLEWARSKS